MKFKIKYIDEITIVSKYILSKCLRESAHIFINGIIGAGKTTLASSIVNICSNVNLCSSSYSIVNVYEAIPLIIHCDLIKQNGVWIFMIWKYTLLLMDIIT